MKLLKLSLITVLIISSNSFCHAQDYYWYDGEQMPVEKVKEKRFLLLEEKSKAKTLKNELAQRGVEVKSIQNNDMEGKINAFENRTLKTRKWARIKVQENTRIDFSAMKGVAYEAPYYKKPGMEDFALSHQFYVKLEKGDQTKKLKKWAKENNVEILGNNKFMPRWYTLACTKASEGNALEMANAFYESGEFAATEPAWFGAYQQHCHGDINDPLFNDQWNLKNQGQFGSAYKGADINYCGARKITQGSSDIKVAVIDAGIYKNHSELNNVTPGYDANTGTTNSDLHHPHGTWVAGIIGAQPNNGKGLAGVAPNVTIVPVSAVGGSNHAVVYSNAINWAWQNGADVLNNSYGITHSNMVDNAIDNALEDGRNGKGCVVVFSAGNCNTSPTAYPANSDERILNVGAFSPCKERKSPNSCDNQDWLCRDYKGGSSYGEMLDIVAPGPKVPTTDYYIDSNGYNEDYMPEFGGTSAAAPHASGVAALLLSEASGLDQDEVTRIIKSTAQKFGNYNYKQKSGRPYGTWNQEMGYGALNARAALFQIQFTPLQIANIDLSHPCWKIQEADGTKNIKPAQLKAEPYGGYLFSDYQYKWETYEGDLSSCSDLENAQESDWVDADKDLDDHEIQSPKIIDAQQNPKNGIVAFRVKVSPSFTPPSLGYELATKVKCWERKNYSDQEGRLTIRDYQGDKGVEPNPEFEKKFAWNSPDIWNAFEPNGGLFGYPYMYKSVDNYVHFRVWNKGCKTSTVPAYLWMYWQTSDYKPEWNWGFRNKVAYPQGYYMYPPDTIPALAPGESLIDYRKLEYPEEVNSHPGLFLLGRIYNNDNINVDTPFGRLTNSNGKLEEDGSNVRARSVNPKNNIKHFSTISARTFSLKLWLVRDDGGVSQAPINALWNDPNKKNWKGIHYKEKYRQSDIHSNIIIEKGKPGYGILQTDLSKRPKEFNDSLGTIKLHMNEPLANYIAENEDVEIVGMQLNEDKNRARIKRFWNEPDTSEGGNDDPPSISSTSTPDEDSLIRTGIYGLDVSSLDTSFQVALEFEVDSNTKYPIPGYNKYNIVREDSIPGQDGFEPTLKHPHLLAITYDSVHKALATDSVKNSPSSFSKRKLSAQESLNEEEKTSLAITPNPFSDEIIVAWDSEKDNEGTLGITVFDMNGRVVEQEKALNHTREHAINTTSWKEGIYLVRIRQGGQILETQKMVKQ